VPSVIMLKAKPLGLIGNAAQFKAVLERGIRRSSVNFGIGVMPNGLTEPRLGIIAAKRFSKRAVDRNRGKRLVREFFRLAQKEVIPLDIVVQIRTDLRKSSSASLRTELGALLYKLAAVETKQTIESP
jgi:ribonuclease P protein component